MGMKLLGILVWLHVLAAAFYIPYIGTMYKIPSWADFGCYLTITIFALLSIVLGGCLVFGDDYKREVK